MMPVIHELYLPNRTNGRCYKRYAVVDSQNSDRHLVYIDICTDFSTGEGSVDVYAFDREAKRKELQIKAKDTDNLARYNCFLLKLTKHKADDQVHYHITHSLYSERLVELTVQLENQSPIAVTVKDLQDDTDELWQLSLY